MVNKLILSTDYKRVFDGRTVVIAGLSRAGTSILGKLVGSLDKMVYLFEPVIMRLLPTFAKNASKNIEPALQLLRGILFEDYYLQLIQGRNLNLKKSDNSFIGNYRHLSVIKERWQKYNRRGDALKDIFKGQYVFALKISEIHPLLPTLERAFGRIKVIHIIRNGNAVISSSLKRGWYTNKFLNNDMSQWMQEGSPKAPWFIPKEDLEKFRSWDKVTRIAYIWRILTGTARDYGTNNDNYLELRYEDLVRDPEGIVSLCEKFLELKKTKITVKNINTVKKHVVTKHDDQAAGIDAEERPLFKSFMKELNYL